MARPNDTPKIAAKRADETCMVSQMIALWCRAHHSEVASVHSADAPRIRLGMRSVTLCPDCAELNAYATARIAACPHMETKTFCSACPRIAIVLPCASASVRSCDGPGLA